MRREKTSVSQEDYLKAIWEMLEEDQVPPVPALHWDLDVFRVNLVFPAETEKTK